MTPHQISSETQFAAAEYSISPILPGGLQSILQLLCDYQSSMKNAGITGVAIARPYMYVSSINNQSTNRTSYSIAPDSSISISYIDKNTKRTGLEHILVLNIELYISPSYLTRLYMEGLKLDGNTASLMVSNINHEMRNLPPPVASDFSVLRQVVTPLHWAINKIPKEQRCPPIAYATNDTFGTIPPTDVFGDSIPLIIYENNDYTGFVIN